MTLIRQLGAWVAGAVLAAGVVCLGGCACADWHWEPPSPLMAAIANRDGPRVQEIVDSRSESLDAERLHRHAKMGDVDFISTTPLHLAVGDPDLLRVLVRGGAAIDGVGRDMPSVLYRAISLGLPESEATMLELGADPRVVEFGGLAGSGTTAYSAAMRLCDPRVRGVMEEFVWKRKLAVPVVEGR